MLVRAKERGHYGRVREPGEVFEVPDGEAAPWWEEVLPEAEAEPADNNTAPPAKPATPARPRATPKA